MVLTYLNCVFNTLMLTYFNCAITSGSNCTHPSTMQRLRALGECCNSLRKVYFFEPGLPITFWPEAVLNANFVRNQSLLSRDGVFPSERWFGSPVDLTTLRTFGSQCFSHVPAKQRLKQSILSNNISCFFLGYHNKDGRYYRLLDPSTG